MRSLAEEWGCDASNATWVVDRLERRGFARRVSHETDRRVRLVVLTRSGAKARAELLREMYAPPPEIVGLDPNALRRLVEALEGLPRRELQANADRKTSRKA